MTKTATAVLAALFCVIALGAATSAAVSTTVAYGTGSQGQPLYVDVYPASGPAVVMVHGGQWTGGARDEQRPVQTCNALQARGVACFSIDYELAPTSRWPVQLDNMRVALEWVREHGAEYGADSSRVSFWGHSSGGHLALMLAFTTPGVESVVAWSPPSDFLAGWGAGHAKNLLGCKPTACPALAAAASPLSAAHSGAPPILLAHSIGDRSVPYAQSSALAARLASLGVTHRLDTYPGTKHAGALYAQALDASYAWFTTTGGGSP